MSDTRTDREELLKLIYDNIPAFDADPEDDAACADAILAAGFTRQKAPTFHLTATPAEIHEALDRWADAGFMDAREWEYADTYAEHTSGFRIAPTDEHMPDHLRPDIGEDRL
jgi:hypothetical protein